MPEFACANIDVLIQTLLRAKELGEEEIVIQTNQSLLSKGLIIRGKQEQTLIFSKLEKNKEN